MVPRCHLVVCGLHPPREPRGRLPGRRWRAHPVSKARRPAAGQALTKHLASLKSTRPQNAEVVAFLPIFQMRTLRLREVEPSPAPTATVAQTGLSPGSRFCLVPLRPAFPTPYGCEVGRGCWVSPTALRLHEDGWVAGGCFALSRLFVPRERHAKPRAQSPPFWADLPRSQVLDTQVRGGVGTRLRLLPFSAQNVCGAPGSAPPQARLQLATEETPPGEGPSRRRPADLTASVPPPGPALRRPPDRDAVLYLRRHRDAGTPGPQPACPDTRPSF